MHIILHILSNVLLGIFFYFGGFMNSYWTLIFFIVFGAFIDIDHILFYIVKHKTLKIKKLYKLSIEYYKKVDAHTYIFHSPEVNFLLFMSGLSHPLFAWLLLSNMIHIFLDVFEHFRKHKNFALLKRWSLLYIFYHFFGQFMEEKGRIFYLKIKRNVAINRFKIKLFIYNNLNIFK